MGSSSWAKASPSTGHPPDVLSRGAHLYSAGPVTAPANAPLLAAARGEVTSHTPVWFMRQAGRSLPEYRAIRGPGSILDAIAKPELAAEITLQPVRRYGVDAAILYSDIVVPVHAIGFGVDVAPGTGPVVEHPFRSAADLQRLRPLEPEIDTPYVLETCRILAAELTVPLIGFAGAPFTVASYLLEGRPSRTYEHTKALMYADEALWNELLDRLADIAVASLRSQVASGAQAVQVFDSWAGALSLADYRRYVLPHTRKVFDAVADLQVPGIHFGVDTGELLGAMAEAGKSLAGRFVVGADWRIPLSVARERVGPEVSVQGNLDPVALLCGWETTRRLADNVLADNAGRPGHIFNLGHGVMPSTDPTVLERLVAHVHASR
jgi:uroporphyrinogen decarboxylase